MKNESFTTLRNYTTLKLVNNVYFNSISFTTLRNYTTLKRGCARGKFPSVLLLLEITLLSNSIVRVGAKEYVLLLLEITLLSNLRFNVYILLVVLLLLEITLLSNELAQELTLCKFYYS